MADTTPKANIGKNASAQSETGGGESALSGGTYEIIRGRLKNSARELQSRLLKLNKSRKDVFGAIDSALLGTERISTDNNCIPKDMVAIGENFIFGYNVHLGLRSETAMSDVFAVYTYTNRAFQKTNALLIEDSKFLDDFKNLYRYYKETSFSNFYKVGPHLFMIFRVGKGIDDIKTFKWQMLEDGKLTYLDNRSDHEYRLPPQHEFEWIRCGRDQQRPGEHPHISIEDRVFVETVGGDLTIKVEDNTESGSGIYEEPVDDKDQTLDDGEISYAIVGNLILLRILPYQEKKHRYIIFNSKVQSACRLDAIQEACVLLPEDHGVIFSNGYYLQSGEYKQFDSELTNMLFLKRIVSPNGEDTQFVFFNRDSGTYVLLSYNIIEQKVSTPIVCHGFSVFENGEMAYFRSSAEPQKHHQIQIWQTPFVGSNFEVESKSDSYLYKLGNKDIVRCMASCQNVLNLVAKDESYANIYVDISREAGDLLDAYFWLNHKDAYNIREPLTGIRETAKSAIEQFEKVVRLRKSTKNEVASVAKKIQEILLTIRASRFDVIDDFVRILTELRSIRGAVISLKDLRYVDLTEVETLEKKVGEQTESISQKCVEFLLTDQALEPYSNRVRELKEKVLPLEKVSDAKLLEEEVGTCAAELEMLVEIVSNLKIEDASWRTRIIDSISGVFSVLNQTRAALKNKIEDLASTEGIAEFGSQMKLLDQAVINYLDVCETPEKCDEYLTKVSVQISELEGKFSDFGDFVITLTEKRDEIYNTFESRKVALVEVLNKKTDTLLRSADRVLGGMGTRVAQFESVEEINGYFAGDLMVDKVRDIINTLAQLGDSVKSGDVQARLKTLQQDTLRQLKDRKELYVDGQNVIRFGAHAFSVNTQELALTIVERDKQLFLHLTGTNFFEQIKNEEIQATRSVWSQEVISENKKVYRAEYLAHIINQSIDANQKIELRKMTEPELVAYVNKFMGPRYTEGYVKGVHDHDAARILEKLLSMESSIGLLKHDTEARALAMLFWYQLPQNDYKDVLKTKIGAIGQMSRLFSLGNSQAEYTLELKTQISQFAKDSGLFEQHLAGEAANYLFNVLTENVCWHTSEDCSEIRKTFFGNLERRGKKSAFDGPISALAQHPRDAFQLACNWLSSFLSHRNEDSLLPYVKEVAALCLLGENETIKVVHADVVADIDGMMGNSPIISKGLYTLNYGSFVSRITRFQAETIPLYLRYQELKKEIVEQTTHQMRLDEFKPRVLSSFVRNRLIDDLYLPLVGENLAKQIGVVGEGTRTDRMGMLLVISPPGYGKTTLMEYIANRLGIIFMKINGPAIGNRVTSIDPDEAPNAAAREELKKLNLALEMGDNVMLYIDDIQHCNPEFLQKFISLCDAQRKIEGVYNGSTRTYDLRGRKVCVVMAGNPYSESGEAFKIPDMLANRADTYNLGDIIGDSADVFKLSYLENCLTSNSVLSKLASKNFKDVYGIIQACETGSTEGIEFEGNYSGDELGEYTSVMKKLLRIRDVILAVNQEYILSAAQSDEYRTEPPFKLQGSYRNMNRLAEKVIPIMNDAELESLVRSHYESEAQTLTTGAEANLLKFKEMLGDMTQEDLDRWMEIKKTFNKNLMMSGVGSNDRMGQVLLQLDAFSDGLSGIKSTLAEGIGKLGHSTVVASSAVMDSSQAKHTHPSTTPPFTKSANKSVPSDNSSGKANSVHIVMPKVLKKD